MRGHAVQIRTFDRKAEAEAWARQLEGEMDRGVFVSRVEAEGTTLVELLDRYQRAQADLRGTNYEATAFVDFGRLGADSQVFIPNVNPAWIVNR
ncbi:MAG: hypothetical protein ACYCXT_13630 [Acidiferrobacteraceae bacterium]